MAYHAKYSPSGAEGWVNCSGWESNPAGSSFADWGSASHEISAECLENGSDVNSELGRSVAVDGALIEVDNEMVEVCQFYVDYIRSLPGDLMVEQSLSIEHLTGEIGATGTADAVVVNGDMLTIADLKTGRRKVDAENNSQLAMYALAALRQFGILAEFKTIKMVIVQPRLYSFSEWIVSVAELEEFGKSLIPATQVTPGAKQCQWCVHRGSCASLSAYTLERVTGQFIDLTTETSLPAKLAAATKRIATVDNGQLAKIMPHLDTIVDWCNAVRAEVERRVFDGQTVPGFKVVDGKKGNRQWSDEAAVEEALAILPVAKAYSMKVISPAQAEKVLKELPDVWAVVKQMVTQAAGKPAVVPVSDKRLAIPVGDIADKFDSITSDMEP